MSRALNGALPISVNLYEYATRLLQEADVTGPPTPVERLLEVRKLDPFPFDPAELPEEVRPPDFDPAKSYGWTSHLPEGKMVAYSTELHPDQARRVQLHEVAHDYIPWHKPDGHPCTESSLSPLTRQAMEREANLCAAYLHMYPPWFRERSAGLPHAISSVRVLRRSFGASLETMGIQYAHLSAEPVAFFIAQTHHELENGDSLDQVRHLGGLFLGQPPIDVGRIPDRPSTRLSIKYTVRSRSFPIRIRPGVAVPDDSIISHCSAEMSPCRGQLDAFALRSRRLLKLTVDCESYGDEGYVVGLMSLPTKWRNAAFEREVVADEGVLVRSRLI